MKFVKNNKKLGDSNAESAEISAEKTKNKVGGARWTRAIGVGHAEKAEIAEEEFCQCRHESNSVGTHGGGLDWSCDASNATPTGNV
jgi:hypothetical protein